MYGYIYKTTNLINGKFYIGQKKSNKFLHEKYLGSGVRLQSAIKHYGENNFTVDMIDYADSKDELDRKEIYWIEKLDARNLDIAYNLSKGGEGNTSVAWNKGLTKDIDPRLRQTEQTIQKRSNSLKKAYAEGKHNVNFTPEVRSKMSEKAKNRPHPPTTKNRKYVTNGIQNKCVKDCDIEIYISQGWWIGKTIINPFVPWNKGLSKETDERLRSVSENRKKYFKNFGSIGCYGVKGNNFRNGKKLKG